MTQNSGINGAEQKGLQPHEIRVVEERTELMEKITKLHNFMNSDFYQTLDKLNHIHFEEQEKAMVDYAEVLLRRINLFEGTIENTIIPSTIGEKVVGYNFNPSGLSKVDKAKKLLAEAIDLLVDHHNEVTANDKTMSSWIRNVLRTAAFNALVTAQMALVKYITWKD